MADQEPEDVFAKAFSDQNRKFSTREGLGLILFVLTVVMPALAYTRSTLFELLPHPRLLLCALFAAGGAVSLSVAEKAGRRGFGIISGTLMGLGVGLVLILTYARFPSLLQTPYVRIFTLMVVLTAGAFPGIIFHARFCPGNTWNDSSSTRKRDSSDF